METESISITKFIDDIEPFFSDRHITYIGVCASKEDAFKNQICKRLNVKEKHFLEANPKHLATTRRRSKKVAIDNSLKIFNFAGGSAHSNIIPHSAKSGANLNDKINGKEWIYYYQDGKDIPKYKFAALDSVIHHLSDKHIALLKIDAEGYETNVLEGATDILSGQQADIIFIKAGVSPETAIKGHYRFIDDIMLKYGYRLFRIYEQTHEISVDSPLLKRVSLAYMSHSFVNANPYKLTQNLYEERKARKKVEDELAILKGQFKSEFEQAIKQKQQQDIEFSKIKVKLENNDKALATAKSDADQIKATLDSERKKFAKYKEEQALKFANIEAELTLRNKELQSASSELKECKNLLSKERKKSTQQNEIQALRISTIEEKLIKNQDALYKSDRKLTEANESQKITERNFREIMRLVDTLRQNELQAIRDTHILHSKAERVRNHLSYRLGAALVQHGRSPSGWLRLPFAMRQAYKDFLQYKSGRSSSVQPSTLGDFLSSFNSEIYIPLKNDWSTIKLEASAKPREVWLTALSPNNSGAFTLEVLIPKAKEIQIEASGMNQLSFNEAISLATFERRMEANEEICLLLISNIRREIEIGVRRQRGTPCLLKIELKETLKPALKKGKIRNLPESDSPTSKTIDSLGFDTNNTQPAEKPNIPAIVPPKKGAPAKVDALWNAQKMIMEGKTNQAIEYFLSRTTGIERESVHILRANLAFNDEKVWLEHLNKYITQFGIAPIELLPKGVSRFHRLSAKAGSSIDQGPLVSVIMPAFNAERTLEFAAKSILAQSWRPLELIIVDDASEDKTSSIIEKLAKLDNRVKTLRNDVNVGAYVSKNLGLSIAKGSYITGHDSDDWAHPERIQKHVEFMLQHKGKVKASITRMIRIQESGYFSHLSRIGKVSDDGVCRLASISCMFEAESMKKHLGYWDSVRFGADSELIERARRIFGAGFVELRQLGMICLDLEGSLTNHPEHGVSKIFGVSPTRRYYRDQWEKWHESISEKTAYLPFPNTKRNFDVPDAAIVEEGSIQRLINASRKQSARPEASKKAGLVEMA